MTVPTDGGRRLRHWRGDLDPQRTMPLVDHLREFRNRLGVALLGLAIGVVAAYFLWGPILHFLERPYCQLQVAKRQHCQLYVFHPLDGFVVRLRVSLIAGAIFSAPVWLYELGAFITPGLRKKERRWAGGFLAVSLALFAVGVFFAYLTVSNGLRFLVNVGGDGITPLFGVSEYLSFMTLMLAAFGLSFEFPVVITFLNVVGVLSTERMRRWRRGMIFALFVAAAVITPSQDPFTFLAMAIPLCLMYEGCILLARWRDRRKRREALTADHEDIRDDEPSPLDLSHSGSES